MKTLITKGVWTVEYDVVDGEYLVYFLYKENNISVCVYSGTYKNLYGVKARAIAFINNVF